MDSTRSAARNERPDALYSGVFPKTDHDGVPELSEQLGAVATIQVLLWFPPALVDL